MWGTKAPTANNGRDLQGGLDCSRRKGGKHYCKYSSGPLRWCLEIGGEARSGVPDCWTDESFVCGVSFYYPENRERSSYGVCAALCPDGCRGGDRLGYDVRATEAFCDGAPYLTDADRALIPYCNGTFVPGMEREWRRAYEREDPASWAFVGAVVVGLLAMLAMTAYFAVWIRARDEIGKDCAGGAQPPPIASGFVNAIVVQDLELPPAKLEDGTKIDKQPSTEETVHPKVNVDAEEAAVETQLHVTA
jgi:hypothetical protein